MPLFVVEWYCFATNSWERFKFADIGEFIQKREDAEKKVKILTENYNPKKMTGFNPEFIRIVMVDTPTLIFEKWTPPMDGQIGTIRTTPENYYVASVYDNKTIAFLGIEANTRSIDHDYVNQWAKEHRFIEAQE